MRERPLTGRAVRVVKADMILRGVSLRDIAEAANSSYDRVRSVLAGRKSPRPGELERIGAAIKQLGTGA
jgi:lambda repressor-like predicted transcriptional regulator